MCPQKTNFSTPFSPAHSDLYLLTVRNAFKKIEFQAALPPLPWTLFVEAPDSDLSSELLLPLVDFLLTITID